MPAQIFGSAVNGEQRPPLYRPLQERRGEYQADGWTGFDPKAENYRSNEIGRDGARDVNRV